MAKIINDILDEAFFQKTDYQYKLALLLSDNSCSYLLYDDAQWLAYRSYELDAQNRELFSLKDELETLKYQDKIFNLAFQNVNVFLLNQQFTFIPKQLFDEKDLFSYLANVTPSPSNEIIKREAVCNGEFNNVYVLKIDLQYFLQNTFPNYTIQHLLTNLVNRFKGSREEKGNKVFMNFHQKNIQIVYFDDDKLIFANNFQFQTANDAAYFLMLVVNQFKLNPETLKVYLSGHVDIDAELYNTLVRYVRNISFLENAQQHETKSPFNKFPQHTFIDMCP